MATTVKTKGPTFSPEWRFQDPIAWRDTDLDEKTLKTWFNYILLGRQVDYRFQVLNPRGRADRRELAAEAEVRLGFPLLPRRRSLHAPRRDPSRPDARGAGQARRP